METGGKVSSFGFKVGERRAGDCVCVGHIRRGVLLLLLSGG